MVNPALINTVLAKAIEVATHSWEYGSVAQALLEWDNSTLSIWNTPFPNNEIPTLDYTEVNALEYVKPFIRTDDTTLVDGDGAAGDPASLGISALLIGKTDQAYYDAAIRQAEHLLNDVPRWPNGAISHREAYPELWADFVYMVPPFLAYYAIASSNLTLAKESALQCQYYRDGLTVTSDGVWLHIRGDHGTTDLAAWSSGNGWAAAGMSRVLATLRKSKFDAETKDEQDRLVGLIKEILDGAIKLDVDESELLRNYLDDPTWFGEISGTSLLAATAFRVAVLAPEVFGDTYTQWAERKLDAVDQKIDETTGIVGPAVNPLNWHDTNEYWSGSPEGQSFVVLMHAAYRDWEAAA